MRRFHRRSLNIRAQYARKKRRRSERHCHYVGIGHLDLSVFPIPGRLEQFITSANDGRHDILHVETIHEHLGA